MPPHRPYAGQLALSPVLIVLQCHWTHISYIRRELHDEWQSCDTVHRRRYIGHNLRVIAKDRPTGTHIRTGDVDLDPGNPWHAFKLLRKFDKLINRLTSNIDDNRRLPCCPDRSILINDYMNSRILQPDGI